MPFPGSQLYNTIGIAYFIDNYIWIFRIAGFLMTLSPLWYYWREGRWRQRIISGLFVILYGGIFYLVSNKLQAEKIFLELDKKIFQPPSSSAVNGQNLVLGVNINGEAKAYPIQYIGYHHRILDTVGGTPVWVTYCTVCRSGRAYSPYINGVYTKFRLVGMDHFNALFEDEGTKSWWLQENGKAIAGKLKGASLDEIPSQQMTLSSWIQLHPNTTILQPDPSFTSDYNLLRKYDNGTIKYSLEYTDTASWLLHSWIVGISCPEGDKVYDWNVLKKMKLINDTINQRPIMLMLEPDNMSFHAFDRKLGDQVLIFQWNDSLKMIVDTNTFSQWNNDGICLSGTLKDAHLHSVPAYQEFWHSWNTFHPNSTVYKEN